MWGTEYTNRYMLCHVCLTSADIYALSKIKCAEIGVGETSKWQHSTRHIKMETESLSDLNGHMPTFGRQSKCMTE